MRFMVTADDFGYCSDTYERTLQLYEQGVIDNLSIMPNMPFSKQALNFSKSNSDISYGVHLTFCRDSIEAPLSIGRSLAGNDGKFYPRRSAQLRSLLSMYSVEDIKEELRAQLSLVAKYVDISYVDSHMHLHKYPVFFRALKEVLPDFGIAKVRRPQNVFSSAGAFTVTRVLGARWARSLERYFETTDHFFMESVSDKYSSLDVSSLDGVIEVGFHPGLLESWKRTETESFLNYFRNVACNYDRVSWKSLQLGSKAI